MNTVDLGDSVNRSWPSRECYRLTGIIPKIGFMSVLPTIHSEPHDNDLDAMPALASGNPTSEGPFSPQFRDSITDSDSVLWLSVHALDFNSIRGIAILAVLGMLAPLYLLAETFDYHQHLYSPRQAHDHLRDRTALMPISS